MENRYALFRVALTLNLLILVVFFTGVISGPLIPSSITDVMRKDTNLCDRSKFLYDLEYTKKHCASLAYPGASLNYTEDTLDTFLCLGVYDTAYKICQYSIQSSQSPLEIPPFTPVLTQYENIVPNANLTQGKEFCNSLQGFASSYKKIDSLLKSLVESLNKPHPCQKICFDLDDKVKPLCVIFAWIKKFDDIKKANRTETTHDFVTSEPFIPQLNEIASDNRMAAEAKKTSEAKETNEQDMNKNTANFQNDDNGEKVNLNVPENVPTVPVEQPDAEKVKSDTEKELSQKKLDDALETQAHESASPIFEEKKNNIDSKAEIDTKPIKNTLANSDSQVPSMNNPTDNVPKKDAVNEEKGEEFNKEQNTDDLKTSTLSENTQDHYDVGNLEEDVDDTIQQSTKNQNENVQEVFEQKNLRYPNIRTEDDSPHFFTYFTVVTVACIAGYIGYHNKQKILAIVLEGRRSRSNRGRRRPSTANYRKLDCTLEEAVTSQCNANVTHVIY